MRNVEYFDLTVRFEAPGCFYIIQLCSKLLRHIKITKMFDNPKECKFLNKMIRRVNNFVFFFNLRQGTILIAVHQIALSSFFLIILLVGISHAGEMLTLLHNDMEDDAERRGFYEVAYGNQLRFHEGDVISTNNQRRFAKAQDLASVTVKILYTSTIMTSIYLLCSIMLLHGAVNYKKEYILPWTLVALINLLLLIFAISIGEGHPSVIDLFNGHTMYHFTSSLLLASFMYAIATVISFSYEISSMQCAQQFADERGERLLLLDHAAHSSLLSAAQLNKLSNGTRTHFV